MRTISVLLVLFLLATTVQVASAPASYTLWLRAHPDAIIADGRSETTISAEVRDASGNPVADGTLVEFTTSVGIIERNARTTAGVARARLQSATNVGTAQVSAIVTQGNAVAQLRVDFLAPGTEMFDESFITVSSKKHLGYDVGAKVVDSAGGVVIASRGLTITAEEAQIDCASNVLRAKCKMGGDNIIIKRGDKRLEASAIYYDFTRMNGVLLTPADDGAKRMIFRGRDLYTAPAEDQADKDRKLDFTPISEAAMFIRARSLVIRPGEEVKIKRANFYVNGDKAVSVPLYVVPLRGDGGGVNQMLTYGSDGLRLDLPLYYSLTPSTTGAFRLRRSEPGGWGYYNSQPGWQLDLEQDYNFGGSTDGSFVIDRMTSASDWGARWTQRKELDENSQLYSYVDFPSHRSLFGSLNYTHSFKSYNFSLTTRANKMQNIDGTYATDAYIQTRAKPLLGGALSYAVTTKLGFDSSIQSKVGSGLGLQLYGKPVKMGFLGSLNTSLTAGQNWGSHGGSSLNANMGLSRNLGQIGSLGVDYTYAWGNSDYGFTNQQLSANLNLTAGSKWSAYVYGTYGLSDATLSAFGQLSYTFAPTWRFNVLSTYQRFGNYSYPDAEIAIGKMIGKQEIDVIWSQSHKRFRIEFSPFRF